ncbi:MAG TPA: 4'-phosphopantetheinyl transferase superfamily protein [Thermoanaerobaculia bacterium]|nr:4'-phosphopantetheinyl transferase superfamily protein [Thermoanaerobaculia bacterium]
MSPFTGSRWTLACPASSTYVVAASLDWHEDDWRSLRPLLSSEERERERRFARPELARRFTIRRVLLRRLLAELEGLALDEVLLAHDERGRPLLRDGGWSFSASHSHELALFAFTTAPSLVGVDVEWRGGVHLDAARDCPWLAPCELEELRMLRQSGLLSEQDALLTCWTRREAYLKALGVGIAADLAQLAVSIIGREWRLLRTLPGDARKWFLASPAVGDDYVAALAVEQPG